MAACTVKFVYLIILIFLEGSLPVEESLYTDKKGCCIFLIGEGGGGGDIWLISIKVNLIIG